MIAPTLMSLNDTKLTIIMSMAEPLRPQERSEFLRDVAAALERYDEQARGPGLVLRICRDAQRKYFAAPTIRETKHSR